HLCALGTTGGGGAASRAGTGACTKIGADGLGLTATGAGPGTITAWTTAGSASRNLGSPLSYSRRPSAPSARSSGPGRPHVSACAPAGVGLGGGDEGAVGATSR
ncbi:MAG: hypothetical protein ACYC6M_13285, partial [Terriglobales bacterium]